MYQFKGLLTAVGWNFRQRKYYYRLDGFIVLQPYKN